MKKVITASVVVFLIINLHAESTSNIKKYTDSNSTSKVEEIKKIQEDDKKAEEMQSLLEYDPIATQMSIEKDEKAVKKYKVDTLDKLGSDKPCYIVASRIKQSEAKIEKYKKYNTNSKIAKDEIEKAKKNIEQAKKDCPNYLQFKGDK